MKIYIPTHYNSGNQHVYPSYNFISGPNGELVLDKVFSTKELAEEYLHRKDFTSNKILEFDIISSIEELDILTQEK